MNVWAVKVGNPERPYVELFSSKPTARRQRNLHNWYFAKGEDFVSDISYMDWLALKFPRLRLGRPVAIRLTGELL